MACASLFLDTRRSLSNGKYKVRIRVTHNRKSKYYSLKFSYDSETYEKVVSGKYLNGELKKECEKIYAVLRKAQGIIKELDSFSFDLFDKKFKFQGGMDIIALLNRRSEELKSDDKIGNSNLYKQAAKLFSEYIDEKGKPELLVYDLTAKELRAFEKWAVKKEYSLTTIGMYLTRTKAIFNSLIKDGEFEKASYPFGEEKNGLYNIPKGSNAKRPLSVAEIMQIYNYSPSSEVQIFAKDIFLFSYLAAGINTFDIFRLKWSDIESDRFKFIRKKTESRKSDTITVLLNDDLKAIIEKHGVRQIGSDYVFPVLRMKMSVKEEHEAVRRAVTSINQALKVIAKKLQIPTTISTYYARHSFATNLMNQNAPLAFISKKLGHRDLATTQNYLDQFTKDKEEEYLSLLLKKA